MTKIAVLVSGGGTNLQALIDYERKTADCPYRIVRVISDHKAAFALERAKNAGIETALVSPVAVLGKDACAIATKAEKQAAVSRSIAAELKKCKAEALVLAGFISVLDNNLIASYENRIINLHPALLPKFGGVGMWGDNVHKAVLASGERESGCTVHLVTSEVDAGRILVQKKVPVLPDDTIETLYARIAPQEHKAIVEGTLILCKMVSEEGV